MLLWMIVFLCIAQPSTQLVYTCNSNASCGCSTSSTTVNRIVNGETAGMGAWGWTVSLRIQNIFLCGGSILSRSWIITAAHCMEDVIPSQVTVYAGSNIRWSSSQTRSASRVVVHPKYNPAAFTNDIALIKLSSPLDMVDSSIHIICLPSVNSTILANGEWPVANTSVIAVGWGRLAENGSTPQTLQQVTLEIVDYRVSTCSSLIYSQQTQLCAGIPDGSKDTCNGDSGGPLMMFSSSNQWILVGLTSYGQGCAQPEYSGVYTRVAFYQDWINSTMSNTCVQTPSISCMSFLLFLSFLSYVKS